MRILPDGLQAHLDEGATTLCHCLRLVAEDGEVLGFTDHDRTLSFDGTLYEAQPGMTGSAVQSSLGFAVDNLAIEGAIASDRLSETRLRAGLYDHAKIELFLVNWQAAAQRILLGAGHLGEVAHGEHGFAAELRGLMQALDQPKGRMFQFGCDAALGDQRCGVDLSGPAFRGTGAVVSAESARRFRVSGLMGFAAGWFAGGVVGWTSGANAGRRSEVKHHRIDAAGVTIELVQAMSEAVAAGDAFAVTAGCDKQFATCRAKFSNGANFRGFPHMPGNDFVASYANRDDAKG